VCAFVLGFAGIVVLMGPDSLAALGGSTPRLWSQLAILAGAVCYAAATVIARKMPPASSLVTSAGVMLAASCVMSGFMWDGITVIDQVSWQAAGAIGFLGLLGTGVASILYFHLLSRTSARFTSLLNFLVPVWAVCLGAVWLGESLPLSAWFGLVLVLGSLILTSNSMMIPLPGKKRR
jgi:drug/metabolite transporter (DMT)-like permease